MKAYCYRWIALLALTAAALCALSGAAQAARVRDLAQVGGVRDNQLLGFGLVGGLAGTGDDPKSAPYTAEAIANMLATFGFQIDPTRVQVKNFAAVMVTANLPAYVKNGDKLDVTVSAIGSAKSLAGGVLYQTLLKGADGAVYAVAQGAVSLSAPVTGGGGGQQKQHMTVGRIPGGALIENSVPSTIVDGGGAVSLNLNEPDFTTASAIVAAINKLLGAPMARAQDAGTVRVSVPEQYKDDLVPFIASLENVEAAPGESAKVVINQRTGTVVVGQNVQILPVAVTHGSMTLTFGEELNRAGTLPETAVAQDLSAPTTGEAPPIAAPGAAPEAAGEAAPSASLLAPEQWKLKPTTAEHVAVGLNKMQLRSADIVAIFEAMAAAGALMGELEII